MNRRFLLALAASALFGLVAILIFRSILLRQIDAVREQQNPNQVVLATTKIPAGTTITMNQVKLGPYATLPVEGSFSALNDVVGKIAQVDFDPNMPIQAKNIITLERVGPGGKLEEGKRAMAIRVDEASSVAGFATPGSIVDVIAVVTPSSNSKPVSKVIVQNIRVLANGTQTQARAEGQNRIGSTVTLEVSPAQAEILTLAMREGTLHLLLRHPGDTGYVQVQPVVMKSFIEEYPNDTRPKAAPTSTSFSPPWYDPRPTQTPTPAQTPTASPTTKMLAIRVMSVDKEATVQVKQ